MDEEYLEEVLDLVDAIPAGRVMTYGDVAGVLREILGRGGARQVGQVMARAGAGVPWWRVVNAAGEPPARHRAEALRRLHEEGCPLRGGAGRDAVGERVDLREGRWSPPLLSPGRDAS